MDDSSDELDSISGLDTLSLHAVSAAMHAVAKMKMYVRIMTPTGNLRLRKPDFRR